MCGCVCTHTIYFYIYINTSVISILGNVKNDDLDKPIDSAYVHIKLTCVI